MAVADRQGTELDLHERRMRERESWLDRREAGYQPRSTNQSGWDAVCAMLDVLGHFQGPAEYAPVFRTMLDTLADRLVAAPTDLLR